MSNIEQLYERDIKPLPDTERLRLAELILDEFPGLALVEVGDAWSDADIRDFRSATWAHIDRALGEPEDA